MQGLSSIKVRRGRDSNSRYGYKPHTHLAGGRLQPLGHLSVNYKILGRKFTLNGLISNPMFEINKRTLCRPTLGTFKRFIRCIKSNYSTAFANVEIRFSRPSPDTAEITRIFWSNFSHSSANSLPMSDFVRQIKIGFTSRSGLN